MGSELESHLAEQLGLKVELAKTPSSRREAQALRHRVFCLERKILPSSPDQSIDLDEFDDRSTHVVLRRLSDDEVIATARVVAGSGEDSGNCLPMQRYCCPSIFRNVALPTTGEISRFAISKQARGDASGALLRLGLLRGILRASEDRGLTHWCALMEPSLLRLLRATGVHFAHLGSMVEAYGLRQPCIARIDLTLARGKRTRPEFYDLIAGGTTSPPMRSSYRPDTNRVAEHSRLTVYG